MRERELQGQNYNSIKTMLKFLPVFSHIDLSAQSTSEFQFVIIERMDV